MLLQGPQMQGSGTPTAAPTAVSDTVPRTPRAASALPTGQRSVATDIQGRLGYLLIGTSQGMADSLSMLADALGRAVKLPRRDGEVSLEYALRLARAIPSLPPSEQAEADRLLALIVDGIKLRMVTDQPASGLRTPARDLVLQLEDVRSRRAGAGAGSRNPNGSGPALLNDAPVARAEQPEAFGNGASHTAGEAHAELTPETQQGPQTDTAQPTLFGATSKDRPAQPTGLRTDARGLQDLLRQAFDAGDSDDPQIAGRATATLLADTDEMDSRRMQITSLFQRGPVERPSDATDQAPVARGGARASDERRASRNDERRETSPLIKGWRANPGLFHDDHRAMLDAVTPVSRVGNPLARAASFGAEAAFRAASLTEDPTEADEATTARQSTTLAQSRLNTAEDETVDLLAPQPRAETAEDGDIPSERRVMDHSAYPPTAFVTRDPVPFALTIPLPAKDTPQALLHRTDEDERNKERKGERENLPQDRERGDNRDRATAASAAVEEAQSAQEAGSETVVTDSAWDFYQRMAGVI